VILVVLPEPLVKLMHYRLLRGIAIVLNVGAAAWWLWTSIQVTLRVGWPALASSGGLLWLFFTVPPVVAVAALIWTGPTRDQN
jgi:hypothetical protein